MEVIETRPSDADEILNVDVRQEYEQRLNPLVRSYATARYEETTRRAAGIEQSVAKVSRLIALSAIGALLFAILIALFLWRSISQPLKKLTAAAREIGKGRRGLKIQLKSRDEIGLLARAFNQMADDLNRTTVSKDYVNGIIESMGDSLLVVSSAGLIVMVNAATCRILGYTETELIGKPSTTPFITPDRMEIRTGRKNRRSTPPSKMAQLTTLATKCSGERTALVFPSNIPARRFVKTTN